MLSKVKGGEKRQKVTGYRRYLHFVGRPLKLPP